MKFSLAGGLAGSGVTRGTPVVAVQASKASLDGNGAGRSAIVGSGGAAGSSEVAGRAIARTAGNIDGPPSTLPASGSRTGERPLSLFLSRALAFVLLAAAFAGVASAQGQQIVPDCIIPFSFTATGQRSQLTGCGRNLQGLVDWRAIYINNGFGALTLNVQSAPDAAGVAGAWVNFVGTVVFGVNPMTATTYSSVEVNGFNPWVSVTLSASAGAGTISGVMYGCRQPGCATGTLSSAATAPCPGTVATPCVVDGPDASGAAPTQNPVQVAGFDGVNVQRILTDAGGHIRNTPTAAVSSLGDGASNSPNVPTVTGGVQTEIVYPLLFNGNTWDRQLVCTSTIIIDDSSMGNVQIIAASGGTKVFICKMSFTAAGAVGVQLTQGTGVNCGVGTANLSGLYQNITALAEDFLADQSALRTAASQAVCLNLSAGTRTTGQVTYAQF